MRALVVGEPGRYAVEDIPEPAPGPGEVLVEVAAAGICGSDLELVDGRRPAALGLDEAPLALAALAAPGGDAVKVLVRPGR